MTPDKLPPLEFEDELAPLDFNNEKSKPMIEDQNIFGQTFNVPGAAIRSALQGKGYVQGALNPSKVKKFQDIFIEKAQSTTSPAMNAVLGMPASAAGFTLDAITSPDTLLTALVPAGAASKSLIKSVGSTKAGSKVIDIGKKIFTSDITPIQWVKDFWGNKKKVESLAKEAKKVIQAETMAKKSIVEESAAAKKKISSTLDMKYNQAADREEIALENALNKANEKYQGKVSQESLKVSSEIRKDLPEIYKQKSQEYGSGLNELLSKTKVEATKSEVIPVVEESLMNHGILNIDDAGRVVVQRTGATKAESQVLNEYIRLKNLPDDATINVGELIQSQSLIKPKYGKVWNSSDHLQSEVSEGLSSIIAQKSPEVAAYRKAYAPFLEWKKAVNKEFRPFAGKFENKKGSQILSKYADVNKRLTKDESNLIAELQNYAGKDYTDNLKSLRKTGREIGSRKESIGTISKARGQEINNIANQRKEMIDREIQSRLDEIDADKVLSLQDIDNETKRVLERIKNRRIFVGTAAAITSGAALFKYTRNRIAYQVFGITNE